MRALLLPALATLMILSCKPEQGSIASFNFSGDLTPGIPVSGKLEQDETVSYTLQIDSGTFIFGYADQVSVDLVVELTDAEGESLGAFDGPAAGHENFNYIVEKTGEYKLQVKPFEEGSGDFSLEIVTAEPVAADPAKRVDQLMTPYLGNVPGAAIGVLKDGQMVLSKAYGKANLTYDIDWQPDMPTNIGSVSKQFTAMSILLLELQGKLSLDDDVRKHIPELPDLGKVVRIRNILNHTNGWREVYNLMPIKGWYGEDRLLRSEVLRLLQDQQALQADPGQEYNYNNSAFIMAAEIVERISGEDFPDFVKKNIFEPLGMDHSYVRKDPHTVIPKATQGYSSRDGGYIISGDLDAAYGAGAIYTTPADLMKWLKNFETAEVGGTESVARLVTRGILNNGDTMSYGLGIGVGKYKGLTQYQHGGADIAHRAFLVYFPEINSGVVALSNDASFNSTGIAYQIADAYFGEEMPQQESSESNRENFTVDSEILKKYAGKYKAEGIPLIIEYKYGNGKLVAHITGQASRSLVPTSEITFNYDGVEATVTFSPDVDGVFNTATHFQGGNELVLHRLPPYDPGAEDLKVFSGRFYSEELETFYTIALQDSILVAMHHNLEDIRLTPTEQDTFSGSIFFMGEVAFQRDARGDVVSFTVGNGRTKGILFRKE